jgi:(4S)-4-hydroxy-5-phosphonooxypentane-2,3-dione isomerase
MYIVHVAVWVRPESIEPFIAASMANAEGSRREPGVVRFDVLQDVADPARFLLVEVYGSEADSHAHKETAHYLKWRDAVTGMMAKPRESVKYRDVYPDDSGRA